jgi:hypothetical protein
MPNFKLRESQSHNRYSNPPGWETCFEGEANEVIGYYDDLPEIFRISNGYQVVDVETGEETDIQQFLWDHA